MIVALVSIVKTPEGIVRKTKQYRDARKLAQGWKKFKKKHAHTSLHIVNKTLATERPLGIEITRSELWCPYCANLRSFIYNEYLDSTRCQVCEVSTREYYVKKYNPEI